MKSSQKNKQRHLKINWPLYSMLIPGLVYLIFNNYIPMTYSVMAFKKMNFQKGIWGSPFCGFDNFKILFATKDSWIILRNTIGYNLVFTFLSFLVGVFLAILLDEITGKLRKRFFQMAFLLPYMVSITVVSYIVYALLNSQTGMFNHILTALGKNSVSWYSDPTWWPLILVLTNQWKWLGYNCLIYYSSVVSIDPTYYDAAAVDGATRFQRIRYVTLPMLAPTIITMTLLQLGNIFKTDFGLFYQVPMNSTALSNVTQTIDTFVYRGITNVGTLGMASAAGLYQSVVGFVTVLVANLIVRKIDRDSAIF